MSDLISLNSFSGKSEKTYRFFASRPVRPGKYVSTIIFQARPYSPIAMRRIRSSSRVQGLRSIAGSSTSFHRLKHSSDISVEFKDDKAGQEHTVTIPSPHDLCNARPTTSISIHSKPYTCRCVLLRPMTVNTHLQQLIFTLGPRTQIHGGRHTVMPSFATILVISAGEIRSNNAPVDFSFFYYRVDVRI